MALALRFAARSDVGMVRSKNDDSAYVGRYLAVVADGMGGHAGGNVASASTVLDLVHLDRADHAGDAGTHLADEIQTANSLLSELVSTNTQLAGMGTTVTALLLDGNRLELAHIGDSRAYRLKDGVFQQITKDHTFVQRLIDEGRLRPEEAEVHPHKNVLMRVLGDVDASPELDLESFDVIPGERWLLCSDGLNAVLSEHVLEQVFRETTDLRQCVNALVELTLTGGSPDNVTVAIVEVTEADDHEVLPPAVIPPAREASGEREQNVAAAPRSNDDPLAAHDGELPGAAIRADVIREDLLTRPHVLVGSAALATETGQIPIVTQRSNERRAAMMLTHGGETSNGGEETDDSDLPPAKRRWLVPAFLGLLALILIAVVGFGYTWTQTRYYVAESESRVAIYSGVPQSIGPFLLSEVYDVTDIPVSNLPEYQRSRLMNTLPASDLQEAERIVEDLRGELRALPCRPGEGTAAPTPQATATATASAAPSTATAEPSAAPAPSPSGEASAGDVSAEDRPAGEAQPQITCDGGSR